MSSLDGVGARCALVLCLLLVWARDGAASPEEAAPPEAYPRVASIRIDRSDVFEIRSEDDRRAPYLLANRLHIETREHVIRRELLFSEGSPADPDVIEESERNLRRLQFLHDNSRIEVLPRDDGRVDVVVHVRDVWTTRPEVSVRREGDETTGRVSFVEQNILGFGKLAGVTFRRELDRDSGGVLYQDPRLLGSWWTLDAEYFDRSDGLAYEVGVERPFYSLLTPASGGGGLAHFSQVTTLQIDGEDAPGFRQRHTGGSLRYGRALRADYDHVRRLIVSARVQDSIFDVEADEPPLDVRPPVGGSGYVALPFDRRFRVLSLEYESRAIAFVKTRFLDKFDRTEDLNLGAEWAASVGVTPVALGDDHRRIFLSGRWQRWFRPTVNSFARARLFASTRLAAGATEHLVSGVDFTWFYVGFPRQTLVFHLDQLRGHNLDGDAQFLLGSDSGLRGYDGRRFDGNKRLLVNLEDRVYFVFDWLRVLSIGFAGFADAGYVWRAGESQDLGDLLADVGVGLRFDITRGGSGTVIRMDYAWPLNRLGRDENSSGVFSVSTGQAF